MESKPFLRGHFHQSAFFVGLGACAMLIASAPSITEKLTALIYSLCLLILFGTSSLYHRLSWRPELEKWIQKLDHSAIFIFIAGTATPICVLGLGGQAGTQLLILFWSAAMIGILKEFLWKSAPRWSSGVFYIIMGWLAAPSVGQFYSVLGPANTWLLIAGGLVYTLGALTYIFKWPNPSPKVLGFHEIFHALVVLAGVCHFIVIYRLVMA